MELPAGTFKGLARVLTPLSFWMAAGWGAYPYLITKIMNRAGEALDSGEVRLFSGIMAVACTGIGIALAIHGFTGKDAVDSDIKALAVEPVLCPYCGIESVRDMESCPGCQSSIPKLL